MSQTDVVADGQVVSMHYTLKNDAGEVLDSSQGREPLAYLHGAHNIVPGLEKQLAGKAVGDSVDAVVPAAEGYGEKDGPGPQPVRKTAFPDGAELSPGMQLLAQGPDGGAIPLWVVEVRDDDVLVDTNHPLAGETLHFAVEIVGLRAASPEEVDHGHPHGPGGHHH